VRTTQRALSTPDGGRARSALFSCTSSSGEVENLSREVGIANSLDYDNANERAFPSRVGSIKRMAARYNAAQAVLITSLPETRKNFVIERTEG